MIIRNSSSSNQSNGPSKLKCVAISTLVTGALSVIVGVGLVLASFDLFPAGLNVLSDIGPIRGLFGHGLVGLGVMSLLFGSVLLALQSSRKQETVESSSNYPETNLPEELTIENYQSQLKFYSALSREEATLLPEKTYFLKALDPFDSRVANAYNLGTGERFQICYHDKNGHFLSSRIVYRTETGFMTRTFKLSHETPIPNCEIQTRRYEKMTPFHNPVPWAQTIHQNRTTNLHHLLRYTLAKPGSKLLLADGQAVRYS